MKKCLLFLITAVVIMTSCVKTGDYSGAETLLENCLEAAEETGIKIFTGLNLSDEWWQKYTSDTDWNKMQADLGIDMAKEIYSLYKEAYPNALYGWYFAWEMYNGMGGNEQTAGEFLNMYLDPFTGLDKEMPLLLSPFVRRNGGSAEIAGDEWIKVFEIANFRNGDIFCCQDAVGAEHIDIEELDQYFMHLKRACDTEAGLRFWANSENFNMNGQSAPINRFIKQMEIAQPYVEGYVTFAYSHYYARDYNNKAGYHYSYKYYYDTGNKSFELEPPKITTEESGDRLKLNVKIENIKAGLKNLVISSEETELTTYDFPSFTFENESFDLTFTVDKQPSGTYEIEIFDYFGNSASSMTIK